MRCAGPRAAASAAE
uniref:Uncharacterized protein n=1 Tax=Arundo donax TaxID=35708 RepID=A0A0A9A5I0_ARUDO